MKKLIITTACVAAAVTGFAQGTVSFVNGVATVYKLGVYSGGVVVSSNNVTSAEIVNQTTGLASGPGASTGVIDVALEWSTSQFNTVAGGTFAGFEQISSTSAGQLANGNGSFSIAGTTAGESVFMQAFAFDDTYGDTQAGLEQALANGLYFGANTAGLANTTYGAIGSAISVTLGAASPAPGATIFNSPAGYFNKSIILASTPEPATLALGGLGAAALLLFRRRK
jgi:hypothetical protein